ncbi:MAG TPA: TRL domain-containing protein [Leptospiraceae bacterium]|nr:TRL domain-containing protein [Leptospiraceae bacterium]HMW04556.1 TRL domain-containing protein [Leptospiraceae bacterium]HMX33449.1 TRL domain-containing protein [Leptospiraceae bacterium]HMY30742.1 TRL domain-containing protein [Leptospiraceae bacterium]HMZ64320.1 TRL domain-containing protein [Leptospiraceae bacterium]
MKRIYILFLLAILFLTSCITSPGAAMFGATKHHLSAGNKNTITSNQILKVGESCSYSSHFGNLFILYYGVGGSINEAMDKAGITKIAVIDRSSMSIYPFYYEDCVLVYGE